MEVINVDKNGKVIEDMSKVILPEGMQIDILKVYRGYEERVKREKRQKVQVS